MARITGPDRIPDSLCRTPYWYRTSFTVPPAYAGKRIWLTFNGINYFAEVWVNGRQLGTIKGAFIRGIFDVTDCVTPGSANGLAVRVHPQPNPGVTHEKSIATGTGLNGGVSGLDGPTFLLQHRLGLDSHHPRPEHGPLAGCRPVGQRPGGPCRSTGHIRSAPAPSRHGRPDGPSHLAQHLGLAPIGHSLRNVRGLLLQTQPDSRTERNPGGHPLAGHNARVAPQASAALVAQRIRSSQPLPAPS